MRPLEISISTPGALVQYSLGQDDELDLLCLFFGLAQAQQGSAPGTAILRKLPNSL